jgi:hypothetical protein
MKLTAEIQDSIRKYLLGQNSREEQELIEDILMTDEAFFQEVLLLEDELVDDYVLRRLAPDERERFEKHFLCSRERHQKLKFAEALHEYVARELRARSSEGTRRAGRLSLLWESSLAFINPRKPAIAYGLAAVFVLVIIATPWYIVKMYRLQNEVARLTVLREDSEKQYASLRQQLGEVRRFQALEAGRSPAVQPAAPLQTVLSLTLSPGRLRGSGGIDKIEIPPAATLVNLHLDLEAAEYPSYRAALELEGRQVLSQSMLAARDERRAIVVVVPIAAAALQQGDYSLQLSGLKADGTYEDIHTYSFRVYRK